MKQIIFILLLGLLLVSGCAIETNSVNGNTNNNANIDNISSEILDHKYQANNEDFVKNIPSSEFFNNTNAYYAGVSWYLNSSDTSDIILPNWLLLSEKSSYKVIGNWSYIIVGDAFDLSGDIVNKADILFNLSCLKDTNIECGEEQLDLKKAVDIAVSNIFPDEIPEGYTVSEINLNKVICSEDTEDKYCKNESAYFHYSIWINNELSGGNLPRYLPYNSSYILIDRKTWKVLKSSTQQKISGPLPE